MKACPALPPRPVTLERVCKGRDSAPKGEEAQNGKGQQVSETLYHAFSQGPALPIGCHATPDTNVINTWQSEADWPWQPTTPPTKQAFPG